MASNFPEPARILVADSDQIVRHTLVDILTNGGWQVKPVADGNAVLDMVSSEDFDLVVMDMMLPGIAGPEICQRIRQLPDRADLPIIFVTGSVDDDTLRAALDTGLTDFVSKPVRSVELKIRVKAALGYRLAVKKMVRSQSMVDLMATAGSVCHELNQPLQFIMGTIQLALMDVPRDQMIFKQLLAIKEKTELMGSITRRLMDITRGGIGICSSEKVMGKTEKASDNI